MTQKTIMSPAENADLGILPAESNAAAVETVAVAETVVAEKAAQPRPKASGQPFAQKSSFASRGARPQSGHPQARAEANKTVAKTGAGPRQGFKAGEFIVYPAHGVGEIVAVEQEEVAGFKLELFVISFAKDKMKLKVPVPKVAAVGMRKLSDADVVQRALDTLAGRARIKRTMWSRRAQEYEAKINSGDLVAVAEVVRDLYRSDAQPEQSYSERQLYEAALDRMAREIAAVQKLTDTEVAKLIETQLQKSPRRGKAEADVEIDADVDADEGEIEEAA